jgi:hypothetical protein
MNASHTQRIRELNDQFRKWSFPPYGELFATAGVAALNLPDFMALMVQVRDFDAFTEDNDPHGEHDFGAIDHDGSNYFWKIDYYDLQRVYHSPDAANPDVTCRVLTVMRADEY